MGSFEDQVLAINRALVLALDPARADWEERAVEAVSGMRALGLGVRVLRALEREEGVDPALDPSGYRGAHDPGGPINQPPDSPDELMMPFGKYKGRLLGEIERSDPGYIDWLAGQEKTRPANIGVAAREIIQRRG